MTASTDSPSSPAGTGKIPSMPELPAEVPGSASSVFADPTIQRTMVEDPLFRFLKNQWSNVLFTLLLVGLAFYGYGKFKENTQVRGSEAADRLHRVISLYADLRDKQAALTKFSAEPAAAGKTTEETEKNKKSAQDSSDAQKKEIDSVQTQLTGALGAMADDSTPYPQLARLYQGLLARDAGRADDMQKFLSADWQAANVSKPERLVSELSTLALARALIQIPDKNEQGRTLLAQLAQSATYANVAAAVSLARAAENAEQAKQAQGYLESAKTRVAKNKELIDPELKQLSTLLQ